MISFSIPSVPIAQPRQRHRIMHMGKKSFVHNYTPNKHPVNTFKAASQAAALMAYSGSPLGGALALTAIFVLPRPQKLCRKKDPTGRIPCPAKPDSDNLRKSLTDALEGMLYRNDSQICDERITKVYAAIDEQPHAEVVLSVIGEVA